MNSISYTDALSLPWESTTEEDSLFRRVLSASLAMLLLLSITLPLLPVQEIITKSQEEASTLTRVVLEKIVLEKKELEKTVQPKPVPRPEPVKPRPQKTVAQVKPKPTPQEKPQPTPEEIMSRARDKAAATGVLAFQDDLQALRETVDVDALNRTQASRGAAQAKQMQRKLVTQKRQKNSSGGIQAAALSTDTGGAALSGRQTTAVTSNIAGDSRAGTHSPSQQQNSGGRSDDTVRRVMDENKGAIFALYNRALRRDPMLEGKVVFEMLIDPSGTIIELNLLSSDLANDELTRKILSRINLIRFGEDDVLPTRVSYSFDFLPYT